MFRSVPADVFPRYLATAKSLLNGEVINVLAREPAPAGIEGHGVVVTTYPADLNRLTASHMPRLGLLPSSYDTVFIPCLGGAPMNNLIEMALSAARRRVALIFEDQSLRIADAPDPARDGDGESFDKLKRYYEFFYRGGDFALNNAISLLEAKLGRVRVESKPLHACVALTDRCDVRCNFCCKHDKDYKRLPLNEYKRLLEPILPTLNTLSWEGNGEAIEHPSFIEAARWADEGLPENAKMILITNGKGMEGEVAEIVAGLKFVDVNFSLNAASDDSYRRIVKGGDFQRALRNLRNFLKLRKRPGRPDLSVTISMPLTRDNILEGARFIDIGEELGVDAVYIRPMALTPLALKEADFEYYHSLAPDDASVRKGVGLIEERMRTASVKIFFDPAKIAHFYEAVRRKYSRKIPHKEFSGVAREDFREEFRCARPWTDYNNFFVDYRFAPCCYAPAYGVVTEEARGRVFGELWNGETYRMMRGKVNSSSPPLPCRLCENWQAVETVF